ncbi:hypothetical protein CMV_026163 [Castanea mollissima]|uniref:EF-1-gamma C-terminal domain-containing protein n=1 Tax=Castanea mollissima TaxID=60419 RepID=A0A8J4QHV6_9ROSI|nr:hypothetical protein CMV_026163 [Castanea mollissima]
MFITTDGALSFCICVCYDDYRYICISFQVHIQQWIDFASFEIDANILAFYGPKIGRAVYLPLRMDLASKYAFGKMLVIGSEPPFKAKGLWLFHGQEIPQFVLDECYDMELYEWKKVDITDEE